jgi:flavin reductase (NADH)/cob(II)yrinic acid a,c-diamide reductase
VLQDAVAAFDCVLTQELETKTHSVFLGEVRHVGVSAAIDPLVYVRSGFHGVRNVRDTISLGNLDARRLSWGQFS